ncbi:MAG: YfhO family protein, partial [Chloroflexota bacterium]
RLRLGTGIAALTVTAVGLPVSYGILLTHQHENAVIFHRLEVATSGVVVLALLLAACFALLHLKRRWRPAFTVIAVGLVVLDLGSAGYAFNPQYRDLTAPFQQTALLNFLHRDQSAYRVDSATNVDGIVPPDLPNLARYESIWGVFNPVVVADYYDFWKTYIPGRGSRLYDLLGVKYLLAKNGTPLDPKFVPVARAGEQVTIYRNRTALPRAFVVGQSAGGTHPQALQTIRSPAFRPDQEAILEGGPAAGDRGGPWPATLSHETGNRLDVAVDAPRPGILVISDVYYPGWHARVDGKSARLYRADYVFQGVQVPAGKHAVQLHFAPTTFRLGAAVSIFGWLAALATLALGLWRLRRDGWT